LELKPNPAEDILTVKIPDPFSNGTVIIKSTKGEILFRKHLDIQQPDNYIFLASDLPAGLALVCLEQGNQIWSRLVMIYN
jgi:hypothetical protein